MSKRALCRPLRQRAQLAAGRGARARSRAAAATRLLELAFGWLIGKAAVASVIAGASTPEQVEQNVRAAGWKLSAEEMAEVDRITG